MKKLLFSAIGLAFLFNLTACRNAVKDVNDQSSSATFELGQVKAISFATYSSDDSWPELKDRAVVDLQVCLQDRVYLTQVVGEDFEINSELADSEGSTNVEGCISWKEEFEYDSTADETYLKLAGEIVGQSDFKGSKSFNIAINPWTKDVIDLDFSTAPKLTSLVGNAATKSLRKQLEIDAYDLSVSEVEFAKDGGAARLKLDIATRPQIIRKSIEGKNAATSLSGGKFKTEFILIQKDNGTGHRKEIARDESEAYINEDGKLVSHLNFEITGTIDYQAVLELVIKTQAVGSNLNLGSDDGYVVLKSLVESSSGKLVDLPMDFNSITALAKKGKSRSFKGREFTGHGFIIDEIRGSHLVEEGHNQDSARSDRYGKKYIELSIVDSLTYNGVNSNFEVEITDMNGSVIYTESKSTKQKKNSGKLVLLPVFAFDENTPYDYSKYKITVRGLSAPFEGIVKTREVYINPRLASSAFLIDPVDGAKPQVTDENMAKILLRDFSFKFAGNDERISYQVNKNMDLLSYRNIKVTMFPQLYLKHRFEGPRKDYDPITSGKYRVSLMILTPLSPLSQAYDRYLDLKDFTVITADQQDVVSQAGRIDVEFSLPHLFHERLLLSFKNIAVITVESLNNRSIIEPGYLMGDVEILNNKGVVEPLVDSRLKSAPEIKLAQSNAELLALYRNKIKDYQYKLEADDLIGDTFHVWKRDLLEIEEKVPVIDRKKQKIVDKTVTFDVFESEDHFKRANKLNMNVSDIGHMIKTASLRKMNDSDLKELCKLFYNAKDETRVFIPQSFAFSSYGASGQVSIIRGEDLKRCQKDPFAHIGFQELSFIQEITEQPKELSERTGNQTVREFANIISRNNAYFISRGATHTEMMGTRETNYVDKGVSVGVGFEQKLGFGFAAEASAGARVGSRTDWYRVAQDTEIVTNQRRIINQDGQQFLVDGVRAGFTAKVKKCLIVSPKYVLVEKPKQIYTPVDGFVQLWNKFKNKDDRVLVTSHKRHIVCKSELVEEELHDEWYFIRLAQNNHLGSAEYTRVNNSVGSIVRGHKAYEEFRKIHLSNDRKIIMDLESNEAVIKRYQNYIKKQGKELLYKERLGTGYPGLVE